MADELNVALAGLRCGGGAVGDRLQPPHIPLFAFFKPGDHYTSPANASLPTALNFLSDQPLDPQILTHLL